MTKPKEDVKERSKLTVEQWREFTVTVWPIINYKDHRAHRLTLNDQD